MIIRRTLLLTHLRHRENIIQMEAEREGFPVQNLPTVIKEMSLRRDKECFLSKWDNFQQTWKKWDLSSSKKPLIHDLKSITTMTLNVLFDSEKNPKLSREKVIHSRDRYRYIIDKSGQALPDIITYNEATPLFQEMLKESEWVRKWYWVSQPFANKKGFGNMILTKIQPVFFDKVRVYTLPRLIELVFLPIAFGKGKVELIAFGSVHLTAYSQNVPRRQKEFSELMIYLNQYKEFVSEIVLQGDMNFHSEEERSIFQPSLLKDAWTEVHDLKQDPGYTFNPDQNTLINEVYWGFQRRKMRLDRILFTGSMIKCKQIAVNFNQPIFVEKSKDKVKHHIFLKGGLMFMNDLLGLNLTRSEKEGYLYPSDHFGLIATFEIKKQ